LLPYDDPSEPFLYYLQFNAQNAAIAAELAGQVGERWRAMTEKLDAIKETGRRRAAIKQELNTYRDAIEPLFAAANKKFETKVKPLAGVIESDVEAHLDRIPKGAIVIETSPQDTAWQSAIKTYRVELGKAEKSLDLSNSDPKDFFPDDGFPVDFQ
jgi:hypothetical protein